MPASTMHLLSDQNGLTYGDIVASYDVPLEDVITELFSRGVAAAK
jgi:hypothetical protein